jgi:rSAM/selenodomain-associated transferase 1
MPIHADRARYAQHDETVEEMPHNANRALVQVFARAPQPGTVKTRLLPVIGIDAATELHWRLVKHALGTAAIARIGPAELWTTAPIDSPFMQVCARLLGVPLHLQVEGDLGQRMSVALTDGLCRASRVLLIGSDIPAMTHEDLREADEALKAGADVVLGPVEDGGYWLIGLVRPAPELFDGIAWSTDLVMQQTRERMQAMRCRWHELAPRWDVDRPEDLTRMSGDPRLAPLVADLLRAA